MSPYVWAFAAYLLPAFSVPGFGPYLGGFAAGAIAGWRIVRAPKDMLAALLPAALGAGAFIWWANSLDPDATEVAVTAAHVQTVIAAQSVVLAAVAAAMAAALGYQMRGGSKG